MKKIIFTLFVVAISVTGFAQTTWKSDPNHSRVGFTVSHLGIADVTGFFKKFDISVVTSQADISNAKFEMHAEVASIDTNVEMRDNHLKSADFFNAEKHKQIIFKSTGLKKAGTDKYKISGNLTINGVTKPVTLDLLYRGTAKNPAANNQEVVGMQVTGAIKRSDFSLGTKFPAPMISDEVVIKVDGEFISAK